MTAGATAGDSRRPRDGRGDKNRGGAVPPSARSEGFEFFVRGVGLALGFVFVYVLANAAALAAGALLLVFAAILLGSALEPIVGAMRARLHVGRGWAVLLVYLAFLLIVLAIAAFVIPEAIGQGEQLSGRLPSLLDEGERWSASLQPQPLAQAAQSFVTSVRSSVVSGSGPSADVIVKVGLTFGEAAVFLGTLLAMVFFWLTEHARLQRYVLAFVPAERRAGTRDAWNQVETRLGLWVRGQLILMGTMGLMTSVIYTVLGLPAALVLGLWAGIAEAIPLVGPLLGAVPALLLAASAGPQLLLVTAGVYVVLQFIEGNVLVPLVMRNTIGISPFLVVVSITIGAEIGGIVGAFLAVPVTAAIEVILERLQARDVPVPQDPAAAPAIEPEAAESMSRSLPDAQGGRAGRGLP